MSVDGTASQRVINSTGRWGISGLRHVRAMRLAMVKSSTSNSPMQFFFEGPAWLLRSGVNYQNNRLESGIDPDLLSTRQEIDEQGDTISVPNGGPLNIEGAVASDLLQERFGQLYVGSTWRRGFPGALNRGRAQYTWLVDVLAGWQWTEQEFNYAINAGLGVEVLGDDELAVTFGYQSAPRSGGGEAGGTFGLTYSARFGR